MVCHEPEMTNVINSAGQEGFNGRPARQKTVNVDFEKYGNTVVGASGVRANFSNDIYSSIAITSMLCYSYADAFYVDKNYLSQALCICFIDSRKAFSLTCFLQALNEY